MSEIWDALGDVDDGPYSLLLRLIASYIILVTATIAEYHFRTRGIELTAQCEIVGETNEGEVRVRYHFNDPVTHRPRFNTVTVSEEQAPEGSTALIEYIPGDMPTSRLKSQARPTVGWILFWINAAALSCLAGAIAYIVWDGRRPIPRSSERRCPALRTKAG